MAMMPCTSRAPRDLLKPLNSEYGNVTPGWGTTPLKGIATASILPLHLVPLTLTSLSTLLERKNVKRGNICQRNIQNTPQF
ncbi:hypothetical protein ACB092_01G189200 [Castanea dentata]